MSVRVKRDEFIIPRCTAACPAGVDVPRYVRAVRDGRYDEAVAVLRERIPFPTVCADACFAPCEDVCAYRQFGDPIAIRALKRVAVDNGGDSWKVKKRDSRGPGKKVAIVGAGPAGLTAAYYLASKGHGVTVFDMMSKPGGAMRYGIPKYRAPETRLDKDIEDILAFGVEFKGNTRIGQDLDLDKLQQDFDATFVAVGASSSARIPLEGSDKEGVLWGLDFLKDVAEGKSIAVGKNVAVVGGGNVAIDVALTAKRLGAKRIDLFCLESREEMPAHPWEIALAEEEGVFINNLWAPKKVLGNGKVAGLGLMRCASVFDNQCNFNPVYDEEITHKVEADTVILAVGQAPVFDFLGSAKEIAVKGNRLSVKKDSLETALDGVFAGGDIVSGPASIISGIAHGRSAASEIDKYLGGNGDISETLAEPEQEVTLEEFNIAVQPRRNMAHLQAWERTLGFDQVEQALSIEDAKAEAGRCLNCDARKFQTILDTNSCKECGYCVEVCGVGTFGPAEGFNAKGYKPMEVKSSDHCVGCFRCFFSCPDFAIDVRDITGQK